MQRRAIAAALFVGFALLLIIGLVWAMLYYGLMLPVQSSSSSIFGTSFYDTNTLVFMEVVGSFFGAIVTIAVVWWWWQQSQKPEGYPGL